MGGGRLNLWVTLVDLVLCLPTTFSHVERWDYVNELDGRTNGWKLLTVSTDAFLRFSDAFAHTLVLVVGRWRCKSSLMVSLLFLESEMGWRRVT